jgi:hypothetical protein
MITLYGFGRVFRPVIDETKDLRVQGALEEVGRGAALFGREGRQVDPQ